ncbi:HBL/NHE enterotoxin family protein [Undibacterium sp.]|uniref:HBL/NHE enterotoxin family protein n=1 Tax=Undibacterium sp. TaxID=1914977 RepID=UPI0025E84A07|nr:HBL/NHE enterotoxin family protein [Undibacterium sp.]
MSSQAKRFTPFQTMPASQPMSAGGLRLVSNNMLAANVSGTIPIEQQLADAFNASNNVVAYVSGIVGTTLPVLTTPPSWYSSFQTAFSDAQIHANAWYPIATSLVSIPNNIVAYGIVFNSSMSTINSLITVLQADPTNTQAIAALKSTLQSMRSSVKGYSQAAVSLQTQITTFANNLTADATIMQTASTSAMSQAGVDQGKIAELEVHVAQLRSKISTWQTVLTASAIAAGVAFWAGAVIAIFSFGFGLAFGIVGAAAGITMMIVADNQIKVLTSQVNGDISNMGVLTKEVAALKLLSGQLDTLITQSAAASAQIALITSAWSTLEQDLNSVITDLSNAETDVSNMSLTQLQTDLNTSNTDWQTLIGICTVVAGIKFNQATPVSANLTA